MRNAILVVAVQTDKEDELPAEVLGVLGDGREWMRLPELVCDRRAPREPYIDADDIFNRVSSLRVSIRVVVLIFRPDALLTWLRTNGHCCRRCCKLVMLAARCCRSKNRQAQVQLSRFDDPLARVLFLAEPTDIVAMRRQEPVAEIDQLHEDDISISCEWPRGDELHVDVGFQEL